MYFKGKIKENSGITIISLIITIIIILILAGVTLSLSTGETGIINKTIFAKKQYESQDAFEKIQLAVTTAQLKNKGDVEEEKLKKALEEYFGENYDLEGDSQEGWVISIPNVEVSYFVEVDGKLESGTMIKLSCEQNKISENNVNFIAKITNLKDLQELTSLSLKSSLGTEITSTVDLTKGILTATVAENGTYTVTAIAKNNNSKTVTKNQQITILADSWQPADKSNKDQDWYVYKDPDGNVVQVNAPKLADGMTAIKYVQGTNTDDETYATLTGGSQWANAMTKDGSMWVWIPRFAYRITSGYHQSGTDINPEDGTLGAGTIEIAFLKGTTNQFLDNSITGTVVTSGVTDETYADSTKWILEPAFVFGDEQLEGFWFAKFEASNTDGYGASSDTANNTSLKLQIKPNTRSWTWISPANIFTVCQNLKNDLNYSVYFNNTNNIDTHMTKNVEWGAVVYLTHSKYGLNKERVCKNNNTGNKTGMGSDSPTSSESNQSTNKYNTALGIKASTTKNIYGIYDMNGDSWENVAACFIGKESVLTLNTDSTYISKYIDVYGGYVYSKYGDAVYETSNLLSSEDSWFGQFSNFIYLGAPIFLRGGYFKNSSRCGLFAFSVTSGVPYIHGFRPVCVVY